MRAALWHLALDALGSLAVIVSAIGALVFGARAPRLDRVARDRGAGGRGRVERAPGRDAGIARSSAGRCRRRRRAHRRWSSRPGVEAVHHLHVWSLGSEHSALSAHVVLTGPLSLHDAQERATELKTMLAEQFGIEHATLEVECHACVDDHVHTGAPRVAPSTRPPRPLKATHARCRRDRCGTERSRRRQHARRPRLERDGARGGSRAGRRGAFGGAHGARLRQRPLQRVLSRSRSCHRRSRGLHLEEYGLRWCRAPLVLAHPAADGTCPVLSTDLDETAASLDACHPGDGDAWRRLHERWTRLRDPLARRAVHADSADRGERAARGERRGPTVGRGSPGSRCCRCAAWARRSSVPTRHAGCWRDRRCTPISPPRRCLGGFFAWVLCGLGQDVGWPVPEGGSGQLSAALVARLRARGGQVVCDSPVDRVVVRDRRAVAVRTRGDDVRADESRARRRRRAVVVPRPRRCRAPLGESRRRRTALRVGQRDGEGRLEPGSTDSVVVGAGPSCRHLAPGRQRRLAYRVELRRWPAGSFPRPRS